MSADPREQLARNLHEVWYQEDDYGAWDELTPRERAVWFERADRLRALAAVEANSPAADYHHAWWEAEGRLVVERNRADRLEERLNEIANLVWQRMRHPNASNQVIGVCRDVHMKARTPQ